MNSNPKSRQRPFDEAYSSLTEKLINKILDQDPTHRKSMENLYRNYVPLTCETKKPQLRLTNIETETSQVSNCFHTDPGYFTQTKSALKLTAEG